MFFFLAVAVMIFASCENEADQPQTKTIDGVEYTVIGTDAVSGEALVEGIDGSCPDGYWNCNGKDDGSCCVPRDDRDNHQ